MTSTVTFFFVVQGKCHDTMAQARADADALLSDGYCVTIEAYGAIDSEVCSVEEAKRELQFQNDVRLADQRNSLIDFYPED